MKKLSVFAIFVLVFALAVPALAADRVIANGVDLWRTPGDGTSFADFSKEAIPAGFFCPGSPAFTGRIIMKGVPIASSRDLGGADTVIERLDNAAFNKRGVATTRIQMRAMQFEGVNTVKMACGEFKAFVRLDGEQPITTMRIVRDQEKGGRFFAPISVNIRLVFEPVGRTTTEVWEIRKELRFPPARLQEWTGRSNAGTVVNDFIKVDTDSDGAPDTFLPGTSNWAAGVGPRTKTVAVQQRTVDANGCHTDDEGIHCPVPVY